MNTKRQTLKERNAAEVRGELDRGEVVIISARYGRSDHNGNHVSAVDSSGRVLGRARGGGYDLRASAMWSAVQGVLNVPTNQLTGNGLDKFGLVDANFGPRLSEFFAQFGWTVETTETYRAGRSINYVAIIRKAKGGEE